MGENELESPSGFMYVTTDGTFTTLKIGVWAGGKYHYYDRTIGFDFSVNR